MLSARTGTRYDEYNKGGFIFQFFFVDLLFLFDIIIPTQKDMCSTCVHCLEESAKKECKSCNIAWSNS